MRRGPLAAFSVALVVGLLCAGAAVAAPGGIGPPTPHTNSGSTISEIYWVVFAICAIVFVGVETTLILFILRFRRRRGTPEHADAPQIHGNTRLEIIWTIVPALALVAIAVYTLARIPAVQAKGEASENLVVQVDAHQYYWQYTYPNGAKSFDDLHLPVGRTVALHIRTHDVNHSWWVPPLTGKMDAIAGQTNVLHFMPTSTGTWEGQCAEFCGIQHAVMYTRVTVMDPGDWQSWVDRQANLEDAVLGKQEWQAVCAKCHGLEGQGDIGPAIAGNPQIRSRQGLIHLLSLGQNTDELPDQMPAVGLGWTGDQYDELIAYISSSAKLSPGTGTGGASGG